MLIVSALSGARSQEFHSSRHMCCDDVTIKVIWSDVHCAQIVLQIKFNYFYLFIFIKVSLLLLRLYNKNIEQEPKSPLDIQSKIWVLKQN